MSSAPVNFMAPPYVQPYAAHASSFTYQQSCNPTAQTTGPYQSFRQQPYQSGFTSEPQGQPTYHPAQMYQGQTGCHGWNHKSSFTGFSYKEKAITPRMTNFERATQSILGLSRQQSDPTDKRPDQTRDLKNDSKLSVIMKHKSMSRFNHSDYSPLSRPEKTERCPLTRSSSQWHNLTPGPSGKSCQTPLHAKPRHRGGLIPGRPQSDAQANGLDQHGVNPQSLTGFQLSSRFRHFCSSMLDAQKAKTQHRRLQRQLKSKGFTDDDFFNTKKTTGLQQQSEKAVSTTNTTPSHDDEAPHETLKVEDQTVSEILSLLSNEQQSPSPLNEQTKATANANANVTLKAEVTTLSAKAEHKFFDRNGNLRAPHESCVPVI